MTLSLRRVLPALIVLFAVAAIPLVVTAHETRTVATDYEFVVGFTGEPAVAGEMNGVLLEVTRNGEPVDGVSDTLQVQLLFGEQTKDVALAPIFDQPGAYSAAFIPTVEGDYTFRFFGELNGVAVDETFTSSPEGFDSVQPRSDYEFPATDMGTVSQAFTMPALIGGGILVVGLFGMVLRRRPS